MRNKARRWIALLMVLALCLSLLPASALAATAANGSSLTELGTGSYAVTLKNDCEAAVKYSVTAGEATDTVTLAGNESLTLRGDAGESYSVTWQGGAELTCSQPDQTTKSGTFGQAPAGYDGFDGYDGNAYTAAEVSNAQLKSAHFGYTYDVNFYYVSGKLVTYYSVNKDILGVTNYYTYINENLASETYQSDRFAGRSDARDKLLSAKGLSNSDEGEKWIDYDNKDKTGCLWLITKATPYIAFSSEVTSDPILTLVNDCDAPVQYQVTIGEETQTVTLEANATKEFTAPKDTAYTITWVGGTDSSYAYVKPTVTKYSGQFGVNYKTVYYLDGEEYDGQVSDTVTYNRYTMSAGTLYAVDTLKIFTRTKDNSRYIYTNIADSGEYYSALSAENARNNIMKSHPGYNLVADDSDLGYAWVFKPVTTGTVTEIGNSTVTVTTTAVNANHTGTFKVAALNVDGMPQSVKIASVYDLKLNEDGPGADGSISIGQYIEASGIDLLALSEDFNFFQEINGAAPSYATMTQRERIPTEVGVGDLNNSLFPFDTDGLNLMYKNNLTVSSESMTAWNEHYSPTTNYVVIDVPDQNGADGMIDKGFRFYQVQMAPGVVVDVYILHMDAETDPGDNAARASQIDQLMAAVNANDNGNPIIIMGDTNCRYTRDPLESTIIAAGFSDPWIDLEWEGVYPQMGDESLMVGDLGYQKGEVVDKVFYKDGTNVKLDATKYFVDAEGYTDEGGLLGDHPPVIVTFEYSFTSSTVEHEHEWSSDWSKDAGYHWHECTADGCDISLNSQKDGYAAHTYGDYTVTKEATCSETGIQTRECSVCHYVDTDIIPTIPHTYDDGEITKEPTATDPGEKTYTCIHCGHSYTQEIPATGELREYTFEVRFNGENYNVGDTVTAGIYVKSEDEGANFGTVGFKLDVPAGLSFQTMTSDLTGGQVSTNGGNFAYNVTSNTPVNVTKDGVRIATATFTVNSFESDTGSAALTLSACEVTEIDQQIGSTAAITGDTANLYNLKVTLNPGNATINDAKQPITLYAKYNEKGLWSDVDRKTTATAPVLVADTGYRLADNQWSDNMADFNTIAAQPFTQSESYTVQTVKTWTVTFQAGSNVTFVQDAQTQVTVDNGITFGSVAKPNYTLAENYTFDGWFNGDVKMNDSDAITGDITVTAKASAKQFDFTYNSGNFTISGLAGVSDGKATYGKDITFTVAPVGNYVIDSVTYTVNGQNSQILTAQDGTYTIDGEKITGNIAVEVTVTEYHTVTFQAGTGVNMDDATAYVKDGQATLYTDTSFTTTFIVPTPAAQEGYRLAADTASEPMWSDGVSKYQTSALGTSVTFTADATLTAQAVKQWTVTFAAGEHGLLDGTASVVVDEGSVLTQAQIPAVTADTGYTFTGWDNDITAPITADTTFTAQYKNATYTLTLPTVNGVSFAVEGAAANDDGSYTVTYGTDVTITMTAADNVKVKGLSYKIGDGESVAVTDFTQPFTIDGESITGPVTVTIQSTSTFQITVKVEGGNGTVNGTTSATVTFDYNTPADKVAEAFNIVAAPGYTFAAPAFETVTADKTYTVTFTHATYPVTGVEDVASATHGTDLTFTPKLEGKLLLGVQYQVGDGQPVALEPNENGSYTIPGDKIIGNITVTYTTVTGSWDYISAVDYVAAPAGKQVALLNTTKLEKGTYALTGYSDMFWSETYSAYVCFVDNGETDTTLTEKLAVSQNSVTEIDYSGNINGVGGITPADSAAINAVLHSISVEYEISDLMRFQFDVLGDRQVTAQDIMWILNQYTGAPQN